VEIGGLGQATEMLRSMAVLNEYRKLLQLQAELVVKLIESARVPGPSDALNLPGLGARIDVHI